MKFSIFFHIDLIVCMYSIIGKCHKCFQNFPNTKLLYAHITNIHGQNELNIVFKLLPLIEKVKHGKCHIENCPKQFNTITHLFKV